MVMDLTKEHPDKTLWKFLLPMMISVMFQQFYNIADSVIVGRFAGEDALAAVGASYPITIIFMAFAVGMNLGTSVVVSRLFGAGDKKGVKRAVTTALTACLLLSMILCIFGVFHNVYSQKQPLILYKNKQKLFCQQISVNITLIGKLPILPFSITKNQIRF